MDIDYERIHSSPETSELKQEYDDDSNGDDEEITNETELVATTSVGSSSKRKRKLGSRVMLTIEQKLEVIDKLEKGQPVWSICQEYGIKKQTVSDIKYSKEKLRHFCQENSTKNQKTPTNKIKLKRVTLTVKQKLELIEKLEKGYSVRLLCQEYGIRKQTVSDIRRNKERLKRFSLEHSIDTTTNFSTVNERKHMKISSDKDFEDTVYKWLVMERLNGVDVQPRQLCAAAYKFGREMYKDFKMNDSWLRRFCKRHSVFKTPEPTLKDINEKVDVEIQLFRILLNDIIKKEGLILSQIYAMEKTNLYWRSLPENLEVEKCEQFKKSWNQEQVLVALCSNAQGLHRLKPIIIDDSYEPLKMNDFENLPVIYYNYDPFLAPITFKDWFFTQFVVQVRKHQREVLQIPANNVRAILLFNDPNNLITDKMCSEDGKIQCFRLPSDPNSTVQPMHQGIFNAFKLLYKKYFLYEVMPVFDSNLGEFKTCSERILHQLLVYNLKRALFNVANAWRDVKITTLSEAWKTLISDTSIPAQTREFCNLCEIILRAGISVREEDVSNWLVDTSKDNNVKTELDEEGEEQKDDSSEIVTDKPSISSVRDSLDTVLAWIETSSETEIQPYYAKFRAFRDIIIGRQHQNIVEARPDSDSFFAPASEGQEHGGQASTSTTNLDLVYKSEETDENCQDMFC